MEEEVFYGCSGFDGVLKLPENLEEIRFSAFQDCESLSGNLILPGSLKRIEGQAFYRCGLDGVLSIPDSVKDIGEKAFCMCHFKGDLIIPDSVNYIGKEAFSSSGFDGDLSIPDGITEIEYETFCGCGFTGSLKLPADLTSIGQTAFYSNGFTGELILPDTVKSIGEGAFNSCNFTGSLKIPEGITEINTGTFGYCNGFESVMIPEGVKEIGVRAFTCCRGLKEVLTIPESVQFIGEEAFKNCTGIRKVVNDSSASLVLTDLTYEIGDGVIWKNELTGETVTEIVKGIAVRTAGKKNSVLPEEEKGDDDIFAGRDYHASVVSGNIYTGKKIKPVITVSLDGVTYSSGRGGLLSVGYRNNKNAGTATAVIKKVKGKENKEVSDLLKGTEIGFSIIPVTVSGDNMRPVIKDGRVSSVKVLTDGKYKSVNKSMWYSGNGRITFFGNYRGSVSVNDKETD